METFICFSSSDTQEIILRLRIYATLSALSAVFLAATLIAYTSMPKLLDFRGKIRICFVTTLFFAYIFLSFLKFTTDVEPSLCKISGN